MNDNDPFNPSLRRITRADLEAARSAPSETPNTIDSLPTLRLAPEAACRYCDGAGYYKEAVPFGHPHFGVLFPCVCKRLEWEQRRTRAAVARLGDELGALADKTFASFDLDRQFKAFTWEQKSLTVAQQYGLLLGAFADCQAYADAPRSWLYIHGSYGGGKSHLAAAIGHVRAARGDQVRYRSVPGMLDALKAGFDDHTSDAIFDDLLSCDMLILDDIGAEHFTSWAAERLFRLTNERQGLPTILTSNRHFNDLAKGNGMAAERIADRIAGAAATIWLPISSYRQIRPASGPGGAP